MTKKLIELINNIPISELLHQEMFGMSEKEIDNILKKSKQNHLKVCVIKSKKSQK